MRTTSPATRRTAVRMWSLTKTNDEGVTRLEERASRCYAPGVIVLPTTSITRLVRRSMPMQSRMQ